MEKRTARPIVVRNQLKHSNVDKEILAWHEIREKEWKEEQAKQGKKPKEAIVVVPNINDDGFKDCWVCEHIGCQVAQADGDVWVCGEICDPKMEAGAVILRVQRAAGK